MYNKYFQNEVDVLKHQREQLKENEKSFGNINSDIVELEKRLQQYLNQNNITLPEITPNEELTSTGESINHNEVLPQKTFEQLLGDAHRKGYKNIDIFDVATNEEVDETHRILLGFYKEYSDIYKLDSYDYAVSGIVGTIAALIDFYLVTTVNGNNVSPGKLKTGVEKLWKSILSDEKIKALEEKYKVSYDISTNTSKISQEVLGLCPKYHRFQSLGHDPILGFIFGVIDLMKGQLTAIDGNGRVIIQSVSGADQMTFVEAIITVFGHLLSDVVASSDSGKILSVPAPFMPLLQLVQTGSIAYNGKTYTVADLSKKMYFDGYTFNHFTGMTIPVVIIEILIRLYFTIREITQSGFDAELKDNPKLTLMLTIAKGILFAENAGKLVITKNPFSINYPAWISTAKYGFRSLRWLSYDIEIGKTEHAQKYIELNWEYLRLSAQSENASTESQIIE